MLFDHGGVRPDQTVLILGAAGNVGSYAVQLAHAAGARVFASAAREKTDYVRSLGVDQVFDGRAQGLPNGMKDIDVVIDAVGGEAQTGAIEALCRGGVLISAVSQPDQNTANRLGIKAAFMLVEVTSAALKAITKLLDAKELRTNVRTIFGLAELRRAHEMLDGVRMPRGGKSITRTGFSSSIQSSRHSGGSVDCPDPLSQPAS